MIPTNERMLEANTPFQKRRHLQVNDLSFGCENATLHQTEDNINKRMFCYTNAKTLLHMGHDNINGQTTAYSNAKTICYTTPDITTQTGERSVIRYTTLHQTERHQRTNDLLSLRRPYNSAPFATN